MSLKISVATANQLLNVFAQGLTTLNLYESLPESNGNNTSILVSFDSISFSTSASNKISLTEVSATAVGYGLVRYFRAMGGGLQVDGRVGVEKSGFDMTISTASVETDDDVTLIKWDIFQATGTL